MLDIDYFKEINDTFTHEAGDGLLKHLTKLMTEYFSSPDVCVRWGGEEFVIILYDKDVECAVQKLEDFLNKVKSTPFQFGNDSILFAFTCGITSIRKYYPLEESINEADRMLYLGKEAGKNRIVAK